MFGNRKYTFVCFDCHVSKKLGEYSHSLCQFCRKELVNIWYRKVPKKDDDKGWDELFISYNNYKRNLEQKRYKHLMEQSEKIRIKRLYSEE